MVTEGGAHPVEPGVGARVAGPGGRGLGSPGRAAGSDLNQKEQVAAVLDCGFSRGWRRGTPARPFTPSLLSAHEAVSPRPGRHTPGRGRVRFLGVPSPAWPD